MACERERTPAADVFISRGDIPLPTREAEHERERDTAHPYKPDLCARARDRRGLHGILSKPPFESFAPPHPHNPTWLAIRTEHTATCEDVKKRTILSDSKALGRGETTERPRPSSHGRVRDSSKPFSWANATAPTPWHPAPPIPLAANRDAYRQHTERPNHNTGRWTLAKTLAMDTHLVSTPIHRRSRPRTARRAWGHPLGRGVWGQPRGIVPKHAGGFSTTRPGNNGASRATESRYKAVCRADGLLPECVPTRPIHKGMRPRGWEQSGP